MRPPSWIAAGMLVALGCASPRRPTVLEMSCPPPPSVASALWAVHPSGTVIGRVTIDGDRPARGGIVRLTATQGRDSLRQRVTAIDSAGYFTVAGVPFGEYRAAISAVGGIPLDQEIVIQPGIDTVRVVLGHSWIC